MANDAAAANRPGWGGRLNPSPPNARARIVLAVALACLAAPPAQAAAPAPAVPLVSVHHHWDHHWFVWLPRHPVYESVEVASIDTAGSPYRAVWVFFTERRGGKRQTHFFDNREIVERFPGSLYRPISYERSGAEGRAQSVRVAFDGPDGAPVEIAFDLSDRPLSAERAGLTDQSGHGAEALFLLFHRDRGAPARGNEVRIGGRDYSFRDGDDPAGRHRFMAAYTAGIQVAVIPFDRLAFQRSGALLNAAGADLSFAVASTEGGIRLTANRPGYRNRIAIDLDAAGALLAYRHDAGAHRLLLKLDAALPVSRDASRTSRRFAVYMDSIGPVAHGSVVSEKATGGRRLTWRFRLPRWAAEYPFESTIGPTRDGHSLTIRSRRR